MYRLGNYDYITKRISLYIMIEYVLHFAKYNISILLYDGYSFSIIVQYALLSYSFNRLLIPK